MTPAIVTIYGRDTILIFSGGRVALTEIWPDESVRILELTSASWLGHAKAMSGQCGEPCYGTIFVFFLLVFLVMLVGVGHLKSLFNYAV